MRGWWSNLNSTLRGFLVVLVIVAIIYALEQEAALSVLYILFSIAFVLAMAFFVYQLWRERRGEIGNWSTRSQIVFYGAALLIVANVAGRLLYGSSSALDLLSFLAVFALAGFAMWRVWRDEHTYMY
jgi:ABC-type nickel/cobalt efflux system permease component RcnA